MDELAIPHIQSDMGGFPTHKSRETKHIPRDKRLDRQFDRRSHPKLISADPG